MSSRSARRFALPERATVYHVMSSFRHHSSASNDADARLSSSHDVTLPPSLLAALAPRLASARPVRETPLTQLYDASAPDGHRFALRVVTPPVSGLAGDPSRLAATLAGLPTLPGLTIPAIEWITEIDGIVCYATAWHAGVAVSAIDPVHRPSPAIIASAGRELCGELHALHRRGLAHGMIVPDTLTYLAEERRFILEDTGVMTALQQMGVAPAAVYAACGNSTYAAPELDGAASGSGGEMRLDMFGLGGTLYELLTGCPPFGGRTTATVMATVLLDQRTTESASPAAAAVTDVIVRCLEQDPADRWADLAAMGAALAKAARGESMLASTRATAVPRPGLLTRTASFLSTTLLGRPRRG